MALVMLLKSVVRSDRLYLVSLGQLILRGKRS